MARKVAWAEAAWSDLEDVSEHIAKDSPHYAAAIRAIIHENATPKEAQKIYDSVKSGERSKKS